MISLSWNTFREDDFQRTKKSDIFETRIRRVAGSRIKEAERSSKKKESLNRN